MSFTPSENNKYKWIIITCVLKCGGTAINMVYSEIKGFDNGSKLHRY